jgi:hypothetical protein
MPVLTMGTVAAAVFSHRWLSEWRLVSGALFLFLTVLGSLATVYGTLGRQAEARDLRQADAMAETRTLGLKEEELIQAKTLAKKECSTIGPKCKDWNARVDQLTREMSTLRAIAVDPRADAIQRLATLLGFQGERVRAIVQAFDPLVLPLFLELGSVLFFASAFQVHKQTIPQQLHATEPQSSEIVHRVWTKEEAFQDLRRLREVGSGRFLAARWSVAPSTVSRWLSEWQEDGSIERERQGKSKSLVVVAKSLCVLR